MKIGILGLGGVGGFVGSPLASLHIEDLQVVFICRGESRKAILENGLTLTSQGQNITARPDIVSDNPEEIGLLDYLIIATKSYSLLSVIKEYSSCLNQDSVVITLQNMVNAKEMITEEFSNQFRILEGCIYVAANIESPGIIRHIGGPGKIIVGGEYRPPDEKFINICQKSGLDISFEENIKPVLWSKYLFVAPIAAITTAYDITFGQLRENEELMSLARSLMMEIYLLADAKGIKLPDTIIDASLSLLSKFSYDSKSSLQVDFELGKKQTEKEFFIDYIISESKKNGLPNFNRINKEIVSRN